MVLGTEEGLKRIVYTFLSQMLLVLCIYFWLPLPCCLPWGLARAAYKWSGVPFMRVSNELSIISVTLGHWGVPIPQEQIFPIDNGLGFLISFEVQRRRHIHERQLAIQVGGHKDLKRVVSGCGGCSMALVRGQSLLGTSVGLAKRVPQNWCLRIA